VVLIYKADLLLLQIRCKHCGDLFYCCRRCYRGQAYCSSICRVLSREKKHREAQRKYRQSPKGRRTHREWEKQRRFKRNKKNVADQGTTPPIFSDITYLTQKNELPKCRFCGNFGQIVVKFLRRGYGGSNLKRTISKNLRI